MTPRRPPPRCLFSSPRSGPAASCPVKPPGRSGRSRGTSGSGAPRCSSSTPSRRRSGRSGLCWRVPTGWWSSPTGQCGRSRRSCCLNGTFAACRTSATAREMAWRPS
ncbi:hypothetical protein lerEdw1_015165 [Lerista edwardsae]|nr:hypothetical protein lerEdw1_015165 [Lerista edwardsae]